MTSKSLFLCLIALIAFHASPLNAQEPDVVTQEEGMTLIQKASRVLAYRVFSDMKQNGVEFDKEQVIEGVRMALDGEDLGMSLEEMGGVLDAFNEEMFKRMMERRRVQGEENLAAGEKFLAENKDKEGVVTLESGVQYKVLTPGEGAVPAVTDRVEVRYNGRLIDGTVFDGTEGEQTAAFPVAGVIRGMSEMLQKMKVGEKVELYIPSELAYGADGPRDRTGRPDLTSEIGPNALLIFKLELVAIEGK